MVEKRCAHNSILTRFENAVELYEEETALRFGMETITYNQLNTKVNQLTRFLVSEGIQIGHVVGLCLDRSFELIISLLAILKCGATFLPIDPNYPKKLVEYMLKDSNVMIVISNEEISNKLKITEALNLDSFVWETQTQTQTQTQLNDIYLEDNLAYILYTSGSSDTPKGVCVSHKALNNFIEGFTQVIDFVPKSSILAVTTISFDIFIVETLLALTKGMTVVICTEAEQKYPRALSKVISHYQVETLQMTPSRMNLLTLEESMFECLSGVKTIMLGGENLPLSLLRRLKEKTKAKIYNVYGPTEATIWTTVADLTNSDAIHIGTPLLNTKVELLDENLKKVPYGTIGEIYISGLGLADGYVNKLKDTQEKFIPKVLNQKEKMYKTGDLGRYLPDGSIEFRGRNDRQIKFKGFRIELDDIENQLLNIKPIREAAIIHKKSDGQPESILSFVVTTSNQNLDVNQVRNELALKIPEYMIPNEIYQISQMPYTLNGKINRKALYDYVPEKEEGQQIIAVIDSLEEKIRMILKEEQAIRKDVDLIKIDDSLINFGIDSLGFIRIIVSVESKFNITLENDVLVWDDDFTIQKLLTQLKNHLRQ